MFERIHNLVQRSNSAPNSVLELLKQTTIGTNGSLYQLLDTERKIHALHHPNFIYLERNNKAIGNITICNRSITLNGKNEEGLYIRYFAFDQVFQGGQQKGNATSQFHHYFKALFETSNLNPVDPEKNRSIYWAFIDPQNLRSFNMNERFGFEDIGSFTTTAFSRVKPKSSTNVSVLDSSDKDKVLSDLSIFYKDFQFFSDCHLFEDNNFYVLKDGDEIVAGIQANPVAWKIKSLPGAKGKFLVKYAHRIPRLRKLINPKHHEFLATEGLYWKPGYENRVEELLEAVLHLSGKHSLLIWTDQHNNMLEQISVNWGFIQKTKENNSINIVAKFIDYSSSEIDQIRKSKKYLSGFDMT